MAFGNCQFLHHFPEVGEMVQNLAEGGGIRLVLGQDRAVCGIEQMGVFTGDFRVMDLNVIHPVIQSRGVRGG